MINFTLKINATEENKCYRKEKTDYLCYMIKIERKY